MKNIFKIAKKYKYLISINILVLLLTFMFPMKAFKAEFASGTNRIGIILEPGVTVSQKFFSKFDKIEKISVLMSTINNNDKCSVVLNLYDNDKNQIGSKKVSNLNLKNTKNDSAISTDLVNYHLEKPIVNAQGKGYYIEISTDCDNIVRLQYCDALENEEKAVYGDDVTYKRVLIRYENSSIKRYDFMYLIFTVIISLFIVLGGKNEKK